MSEWDFVKLGSLAHFKNGLNFSKDSWGKGIKIIGVSDFKDYLYPRYETLAEINQNGVIRKGDYLEEDDILFVRSNGNRLLIGRSLHIKKLTEKVSHSGFTIRLRFTSSSVYVPFYVHLLRSSLIRSTLSLHGGGTNINNLNQEILSDLVVPVPPLSTQKKIAAVLSAYDDLIENNDRRIALLEKMAEEIYREWFVRLRFPGFDRATFHKGIPEGWEVKCVKELVDRKKFGRIYRENELHNEGQIIVIDQSRNDCLGFYDGKPEHTASKDEPFILFGDHTCKLLLINRNFSLAENVIPLKPKENIPVYYLFHLIQGLIETTEYKRHWTELCNKQVFVAPRKIQLNFNKLIKNNYNSTHAIICTNKILRKTRDRLLTRLISGKLSVEDLDIQFPPSMTTDP